MKYLSAIFLLLITFAFAGCGEEEVSPDDSPYYTYDLKVKIIDKHGNNLLKGLECEKISVVTQNPYMERRYIAPDLYSCTCKRDDGDRFPHRLYYVFTNNEEYFDFHTDSPVKPQFSVSFFLYCEQIFGDNERHEIAAYYPRDYYDSTPEKVTFDGVEQEIGENAQVTVTVDR